MIASDSVLTKIVLITGPSPGGLGAETAVSLAQAAPAMIILIGRSQEKCQPTIDAIKKVNPVIAVKFFPTDLQSMASVRETAQAILNDAEVPHIDVMINNAGIMAVPQAKTTDGFERQLATNHLSHFILVNKLMPKLLAAPSGTRVVNVSSVGNKYCGIVWDDPNFDHEEYKPMKGYGQSKTANVLFSIALNKRFAARGLRSWALNPGSVSTNLQGDMTLEMAEDASQVIFGLSLEEAQGLLRKTLQQGCSTQLLAALDPELEKQDGVFMNDCQVTSDEIWVKPWALDPVGAERLWHLSEDLIGEKFEY
jgi:NAD(P)-dependent dehydrogenase (short-subunit alcohol dehydrogenase family)